MSAAPVVDPVAFVNRLERLYSSWESEEEEDENHWRKVDALSVIVGKDDDILYSKSTALQTWLFGYELADTLCVFCANDIHILSSKKKIEFLRPLESALAKRNDLPDLQLHMRNKADKDAENFQTIAEAMKKSKKGKNVGVFQRDAFTGEFVETWKDTMASVKIAQVDVSGAFAYSSACKDEAEIGLIKKACLVTCAVFSKYVKREIVTIVDEEKRVKHSKLAEGIEQAIAEDKKFIPAGVDPDSVEICYSPIIQSGGNYQLKFSTLSTGEKLHFGTIICCLGVRYRSYCSNIVRTMFVEPTQEMQDNYTFLLSVYEAVLVNMRHGKRLCDVYTAVSEFVDSKRPDLKDHLTRNLGFATGIEFREGSLLINPKCPLRAQKGMVFNVNVGFAGLSNPSAEDQAGESYALFVGDTVLVGEDEPATELTAPAKKKISSIAIFLGNEEEEENGPGISEDMLLGREVKRTAILHSRTRTEQTAEDRRKEHQSRLAKAINAEAKKRLLEGQQESLAKRPKLSANVAYKHSSVVPRDADVQNHKIFVDRKYEATILPIHGIATPFHISTLKNCSKSEEGEYVYLRINFFHPGSSLGRVDGVVFPNPEAAFVKEVSFRASSKHGSGAGASLVHVFNLIKDVQKRFKTREQEKRELEGYVEQDTLILNTSKGNPRLRDLYMRPVMGSRRIQGTLEAHTNGLRYTTLKGDRVDILFNNVKHAFFQPSKGEMIVLLHFHLKHPIIIGKKKHKDIQFYTEVGEIMTDLGRAQHMHDRDDLIAEQAERELRAKLDNAFDTFRKKVESLPQCKTVFEKPFKELGFHGVPFRSTVLLQPTTNCIVSLSDQPAFITTLDEVELVHFERVQFHMRNFDMVFVFKDYKKKVASVTAIPMTQLDPIKEWLNSCDIKYTEGLQNLNWAKIMKTINDDPEGFFSNGGWSFLDPDSDNEGDGDSDSDQEEEYCPSSEDDEGQEESDSDEEYTSISEGMSESEDEDESEESGMDWDDLEDEAKRADKERDELRYEEEREERRRPPKSPKSRARPVARNRPVAHKSSGRPTAHKSSGRPTAHKSSASNKKSRR